MIYAFFVEKMLRVAVTHLYGPNRSGCLDWGVGGSACILGTFGPAFPPLHLHLNSHSHVHIKIDGEHSHSIERYFLPQTIHKTFAAKNIWKNIRMIPPNDEKNIALMHTKKVY